MGSAGPGADPFRLRRRSPVQRSEQVFTSSQSFAHFLRRKTQAFAKQVAHKGIWVEPKLLAEIKYRAKSAEGKVRHPFFRGLREDL